MKHFTLPAILAAVAICATVASSKEMPSSHEISSAISQTCANTADISLQQEPVRVDLQGLKATYPELGSIVGEYKFRWSVDASYTLGESSAPTCLTVIRMQSPLDAFGPFSIQRTTEASVVPLPTSAYWLPDALHVWRGEYYVRACIPEDGADAQQQALELVTRIMNTIPIPETLPDLLWILPWEARQVKRPRYERRSVLGLEFLHNGVHLDYTEGNTTCTLVVTRYETVQQAAETFEIALSGLARTPPAVETIEQMGDAAAGFQTDQFGSCLLMREQTFVAMVLHYHDTEFASELLRATGSRIRTYLLAFE